MAQPNVAREPSMEEILASIRRIIESNEPGPGVEFAADTHFSEDANLDGASEIRSPPAHVPAPANQAFGQRQAVDRAPFQPQPVQGEPSGEKSMSLADVAARVRAAADRNAAAAVTAARAPEPAAAAPVFAPQPSAVQPQAFYGDPNARPQRPTDNRPLLAQAAPVIPREETQQRIQDSAERMVETPPTNWNDAALRGDPLTASFVPEPVQPVVSAAPPRNIGIDIDEQKPMTTQDAEQAHSLSPMSANLLSQMAEAEIARSFDELQTLFNADAAPNVEEMTREMLRPMLQDWLEDNLPTIVERLVREEIARVVRGPKR